nr:MAG: maturation protein [Sanya fiers-like virus 44]
MTSEGNILATISENKVVADVRRQLYQLSRMDQRKTLVIPPDGSQSYLKDSNLALDSSNLRLGSSPTQIVYGLRGCKRHSDIKELRRGQVNIPDLAYSWYRYERYPGAIRYDGALIPTGVVAYDYASTYRAWEAEFYAGNGHTQSSELTTLVALNQRLLSKAKGEVWNAPVFLAEAKKTTDMVVSRAADMVRLVRLLRSGRIDQFLGGLRTTLTGSERNALKRAYNKDYGRGDVSKAAANAWLETTYGWTPFMMDVYQGMETLEALSSNERAMVGTVRASVKAEGMLSSQSPISAPFVGTRVDYAEYRESRRGVWRFKPRIEAYMLGKLGFTNPLLVAWELLPFSFVADWFLPIGDFLEVLDVPLLCQHVGGTHGLRRETYTTRVMRSTDGRGKGESNWTRIDVNRNPYTEAPHVDMSLLTFNPKLGAKRVASAAALLRQVLTFKR